MMGKKNNGKGIMIFVVGIILIAYLGYFSEALSTDKKNYVVGETVIIDMEYYAGSSLEVIRGEDAYRLFGSPDGEQKFIPSKPGDYNIIIYDASGNVVETASFSVYGTQDEIPKQGSISIKTGNIFS